MTRDELYDLEKEVLKEIERVNLRQMAYANGMREGITLAFTALHDKLLKNSEKEKEQNNETEDK